ncbi:MAG TPA: hypothetical protein VHL77_11230, partial [Ferruginibacter sp.]|nr:hypothetical protein [Ferruginibacter sp.]
MKKLILLLLIFISTVFQLSAQDYKLEGNEVKTDQLVIFESGSDQVKPESMAALEIIKKYLTDKSYISLLRVECHTDNSGDVA